jgi:cyanophycinase
VSTEDGTLVLLGGDELGDPVLADLLLARAPGPRVAVIPMAAAFSHPEAVALRVAEWLGPHGGRVEALMASTRADAQLGELADRLADADLVYLADGAALHLRTALRETALFEGLVALLERGGLLAASGAAATVLCDPMIDPRGGAPTVGLGLVRGFTVVTHVGHDQDDPHEEKLQRAVALCPPGLPLLGLRPGSAAVFGPVGPPELFGRGGAVVYLGGQLVDQGVGSLRLS